MLIAVAGSACCLISCLVGGVDPETADLMYAAVYRWGPRWGPDELRGTLSPSETEVRSLQSELRALRMLEGTLSPQRIRGAVENLHP